jgi:hypothetical protein
MSNLIRQGDSNLANFGQLGGCYITSTDDLLNLSTKNYRVVAIQSLDDLTQFAETTESENKTELTNGVPTQEGIGFPDLGTTQTIKHGVIIFGRWKKVKLNAGSAIVYFA